MTIQIKKENILGELKPEFFNNNAIDNVSIQEFDDDVPSDKGYVFKSNTAYRAKSFNTYSNKKSFPEGVSVVQHIQNQKFYKQEWHYDSNIASGDTFYRFVIEPFQNDILAYPVIDTFSITSANIEFGFYGTSTQFAIPEDKQYNILVSSYSFETYKSSLDFKNDINEKAFVSISNSNIPKSSSNLKIYADDNNKFIVETKILPHHAYIVSGQATYKQTTPSSGDWTLSFEDSYYFEPKGVALKITQGDGSTVVLHSCADGETRSYGQSKNKVSLDQESALNENLQLGNSLVSSYLASNMLSHFSSDCVSLEADVEFCDYTDVNGVIVKRRNKGEFFVQGDTVTINTTGNGFLDGKVFKITDSEMNYKNGETYIHISALEIKPTYYNVYFYEEDGTVFAHDSVLEGESATAPSTYPTTTDTYNRYKCIGWALSSGQTTPVDVSTIEITQDTNFYPVFVQKTLEEMTWAEINALAQAGLASSTFSVGDTKTLYFTDDTSTQAQIIDFNHDRQVPGGATTPITFATQIVGNSPMYNTSTSNGIYTSSDLYNSYLPTVLAKFPSELSSALKDRYTGCIGGSGNTSVASSTDKIFLFSEGEVFGTGVNNYYGYDQGAEGHQYAYFVNNSKIKTYFDGTAGFWWLTTHSRYVDSMFIDVTSNGGMNTGSLAKTSRGVVIGFCI